MVLPLLVALVLLAVGGYLLYAGGSSLRTVGHILRNDPVPVRELHGHTGPVEVEGTARTADGETVTAPFTGTPCLAYTYEVEELRSTGKSSSWRTLDEGMAGVDFVVEDDTGRVRVDPEGAEIRLGDHTLRVGPGDELPERLARYVEQAEDIEKQDGSVDLGITELHLGNEQRFTERRLDRGESVYVFGQAARGPSTGWGSDPVDAVVSDGPGTPVFVVSDTDERRTAWRFATDGLWRVAVGTVILAALLWFGRFWLPTLP